MNNMNMMMNKFCNKNLGLLLIRLALAAVFIFAGFTKLMSLEQTVGFFGGQLGLPSVVTYLVVAAELLGGIAMLLGIFVMYAGALLAVVMAGAIILVTGKMGFAASQLPMVLLATSFGLAMLGGGAWSLDKMMGAGSNSCDGCGDCTGGMCSKHE